MTINYKLGKIYKIVDNTTGNIYIGSTCEKNLSRRLMIHLSAYKRYSVGKMNYITSFEVLKNEDFKIQLLEFYPCNSKVELLNRERYFQNTLICVNKCRPGIKIGLGKKEYDRQWRDENKEHCIQRRKKYINDHKEYLYKENKCLCSGHYTNEHYLRHLDSKKHKIFFNISNHIEIMKKINDFIIEIDNFLQKYSK
jgi:hypothetical protein